MVVPFAQLPPAVQKSIQAQLANGTLGPINRSDEDGDVRYTVEITKGGQVREYGFDESGALVSTEMALTEAPLVVQKTIQGQIGGGTVEGLYKTIDDGAVSYDADWKTKDGAERSLTVLESGKLESIQVGLEETPAAVRAAIVQETGSGQVQEVVKSFEDNAVYYDVTVNREGKDREFTVTEGGKLDSRQVFLGEIPAPAQATIQRTIGQGRLVRIDQVFEKKKNVFPYEVEAVVEGKAYDFSVGPKGLFLGVD
jgi:uncharacterized membrane protein YkoI